jgi:hypothetical protein
MRNIMRLPWLLALGGLLVLCGLLLFPALGLAQGNDTPPSGDQAAAASQDGQQVSVTLSDKTLSFHGLTNEALKRTLTLKVENGAIHTVTVTLKDLVDATSGAVILSSDVTVDPTQATEIADKQLFSITIGGNNIRPGHYGGELSIWYQELEPRAPLTVPLSVTFEAVPQVDVDVSSKNRTIHVELAPGDFPYVGHPSSGQVDRPLAELPVYLVQKSQVDAEVQEANVLTMIGPDGRALPDGVVQVASTLPFTLTGQDAAPLRVVVAGHNLAAGEYDGTMLVRVRNQAAPIEVPLKILIKHGFLFPLLLLAASILIGVFLAVYNTKGLANRKYSQQIRLLDARIDRGDGYLQNDAKAEAARLLERAVDAVLSDEGQQAIEEQIKAVQDYLEQTSSAAAAFLQEAKFDEKIEQVRDVSLGTKARDQLVAALTEIEDTFKAGGYASLAEAKEQLKARQQEVDALLQIQTTLGSVLAKYPKDKVGALTKSLNEASSLQEIKEIADKAAKEITPTPPPTADADAFTSAEAGEVSYDLSILDQLPAGKRKREIQKAWNRFELRTKTASLTARLIVYLFALLVGWATLYLASPTFGAKPEDYIALFLWGVAANVVGGQSIDLKTIYQKETKPGQAPAEPQEGAEGDAQGG